MSAESYVDDLLSEIKKTVAMLRQQIVERDAALAVLPALRAKLEEALALLPSEPSK